MQPDVRPHLFRIRRAILDGCRVLFSRVIPLDCTDPHTHPLWRLAEDVSPRGCLAQAAQLGINRGSLCRLCRA